jgi:hypothetical protein
MHRLTNTVDGRAVGWGIAVLAVKDIDPFLALVCAADSEPHHRRYRWKDDGSHKSWSRTSYEENFPNVM